MSDRPSWAFAYGSLIWNPSFDFQEKKLARLFGYHRRLCIESKAYRGTEQTPGLVFGLCRGGSCTGIAYKVGEYFSNEDLAKLRTRELNSSAYAERLLSLRLKSGEVVQALCYIANTESHKYYSSDHVDDVVSRVSLAKGQFGTNRSYVLRTARALNQAGCPDKRLERLCERITDKAEHR